MGFDSDTDVSPLDFDLSKHKPGCKGTIPEPSQALVDEWRQFVSKHQGKTDTDAIRKAQYKAVSKVCNGSPSVDDLAALPWRVFVAFNGWLTGQLLNPS